MHRLRLFLCLALVAALSMSAAVAKPRNAVKELVGKRTANSKTWQNSDGYLTSEISSGPIHYLDSNGDWQDIDTSFGEPAKSHYRHSVMKNPVKVHLGKKHARRSLGTAMEAATVAAADDDPSGDDITLETDKGLLSFTPQTQSNDEPIVDGCYLRYVDAWPSVDLLYTVRPDGVKEDIVLKQHPSVTGFRFTVNHGGLDMGQNPDGSIVFTNHEGIDSFYIPAAYMVDANGNRSDAVSMTLESVSDGSFVLCVTPDQDWLAGAAYPVIIDPTVTSVMYPVQSMECSSTNPNPTTAWWWTATSLNVGYYAANTTFRRGYIRWDVPSIVPPAATVTSATISLSTSCSLTDGGIYRLLDQIPGPNGHPLPQTGSDPVVHGAWPAGGYATWTGWNDDEDPNYALANMVQEWVNGVWPCYGVELRSIDPNATAGLCYASYSSLNVTYSLADTNPPSTPQVLGDIDFNSHLHATWTSSDQEGEIWQYQYAIGTSPGADNVLRWTTVPGTQTEVTNTSIVLTGRVTYYYSVKARDDSGNWSPVGVSNAIHYGGSSIIYVSKRGVDGSNNGKGSWSNAKLTVGAASAAASAGDQIWVAEGTYVERITLTAGVALYGGFPDPDGIEPGWSDRDPKGDYQTILDGGQGGSVVTATGSPSSIKVIDGFNLTNGSGTLNSSRYGGAVYCSGASVSISNCIIDGNCGGSYTQSVYGGGIYCGSDTHAVIEDNDITSNHAISTTSSAGGGIYANGSCLVVSGNLIQSNQAKSLGSGIYLNSCNLKSLITGNKIISNSLTGTTTSAGIGIHCNISAADILGNTVTGNSAAASTCAGIALVGNSSVTVASNLVASNVGGNNSGVYSASTGQVAVTNNTIISQYRGVFLAGSGVTVPVINNILASCTYGMYRTAGAATLKNNCYCGNTTADRYPVGAGTDEIVVPDVKFKDAASGNYDLDWDSPCVDAGDDSAVLTGWTDVRGQPRKQGAHVDIGAYEPPPTLPLTVTVDQVPGQQDPTDFPFITYLVTFSRPVVDFSSGPLRIASTLDGSTSVSILPTSDGVSFYVGIGINSATHSGTISLYVAAGLVHDAAGYANLASTSTDNQVTYNPPFTVLVTSPYLTTGDIAPFITWSATLPFDSYQVQLSDVSDPPQDVWDSGVSEGSIGCAQVTHLLTNGATYSVKVQVRRNAAVSDWSAPSVFTLNFIEPPLPTHVPYGSD